MKTNTHTHTGQGISPKDRICVWQSWDLTFGCMTPGFMFLLWYHDASVTGRPSISKFTKNKQTRLLFIWIFTTYKPALREPGLLWSWETVDPTERGQRGWEKQNRVLKVTLQGKSQRWGARTSPPMVGRMTVIGKGAGREAGESGWRGIWLNLHLGKRQAGQGKTP